MQKDRNGPFSTGVDVGHLAVLDGNAFSGMRVCG